MENLTLQGPRTVPPGRCRDPVLRSPPGRAGRGQEAWRKDPGSGTKSPGGALHRGSPTGTQRWEAKGREDWKALVTPHRTLPCSKGTSSNHYVQSSTVKPASSHGLPSHRAPKEALTGPGPSQKLSQAPGQRPLDRPWWHIPSCGTSVTGASLTSKRRRRRKRRASQRGRGGRGRGGGSAQLCRCCCEGFLERTRWPQAGLPHPPAGQDGSGSAQSEAAVPAVCSYRDRVWLLCLQYSPKAKGTADLSGRPGTFLQAMMGKGSPAAAQGINSSLPASCLYSQPGSTVK